MLQLKTSMVIINLDLDRKQKLYSLQLMLKASNNFFKIAGLITPPMISKKLILFTKPFIVTAATPLQII